MKKKFNLEGWLSDKSQKLVTSYGEPAKIVFTEGMGTTPILAVIWDGDTTDSAWFTKDGKSYDGGCELLFADKEPDMLDFEKAIEEMCCKFENDVSFEQMIPFRKECAKKLLDLARELLTNEILKSDVFLGQRDADIYEKGKADGIAETEAKYKNSETATFTREDFDKEIEIAEERGKRIAKMSLPMWRYTPCHFSDGIHYIVVDYGFGPVPCFVYHDMFIPVRELLNLERAND